MFDVKRLIELRRCCEVVWSPCGTWVCVAAQRLDAKGAKYVSDLWRVPLDGGQAVQLTRGESNDSAPCFRRDGALGFTSNRPLHPRKDDAGEADPRTQVWLLGPGPGEPRALTNEPIGVLGFQFAKSADRLVVLAGILPGIPAEKQREVYDDRKESGPSAIRYRRMPVRYWDHWLPSDAPHVIAYDEEGRGRLDLTPQADRDFREGEWDLSADGTQVVITRRRAYADRVDDVDLVTIDTATGALTELAREDRVHFGQPRFSPDRVHVAASHWPRSEEAFGKVRLAILSCRGGARRFAADEWDRCPLPWAWVDDDTVACTVDDDGFTHVATVSASTDQWRVLTADGTHGGLCCGPDGRITGLRHRFVHPPEAFVLDPAGSDGPRVLSALAGYGEDDVAAFARVESVRVPVAGVPDVQAWVITPTQNDGPRPLLMWIHGGPIHAWSDCWHWRWNALAAVAQGYTVVMPNPSGSTGFGQAMIERIWGNVWGAQCYVDLMAVADAMCARDDVDERRTMAMGGSFGGYMTNWIGGQTDRFRCLITHASVFDLSAFHGVTDFPGFWVLQQGGTSPYTERAAFDRYSPREYLADWKSPTLVIHGDRDYRVPVGESLALFEGLQGHGVESELLLFPDENHWIMKPRNVVVWYDAVMDWLGRYL